MVDPTLHEVSLAPVLNIPLSPCIIMLNVRLRSNKNQFYESLV